MTEGNRTSRHWQPRRARGGVHAGRFAVGCLAALCLGAGACSNTALDLGFRDAAAFANPDPGLLAHWALDESQPGATVVDSSGFGNDGKPSANPPIPMTDVPPVRFKDPHSFSFNGQDQWIELGNPSVLNIGGPITLAAWIRPLATDRDRNVIAHGYRWDIPHDFALRIHEGVYRFTTWDSSDHAADATMDPSQIDTWVHLCGVFDGTTYYIYVNGALAGSRVDATQPPANVDNIWAIGARAPQGNNPSVDDQFQGQIDDVRIYGRALRPDEINALYLR